MTPEEVQTKGKQQITNFCFLLNKVRFLDFLAKKYRVCNRKKNPCIILRNLTFPMSIQSQKVCPNNQILLFCISFEMTLFFCLVSGNLDLF